MSSTLQQLENQAQHSSHWYTARGVNWRLSGKRIFDRLVSLGLGSHHSVLDVGCGDLRVGVYLIGYLEVQHYYATDSQRWLVDAGCQELPYNTPVTKSPQFCITDSFNIAGIFPCSFDYILMSSVWTHASHEQIRCLLESASRAGTRNVIVLADYRDGNPDYLEDSWGFPNSVFHCRECIMDCAAGLWSYQELDRDTNQWCALRRVN